MYDYKAQVVKVVDGDTIDILIDLGFNIKIKQRIRLAGIDTPEINSKNIKERQVAKIVRERLESLIKNQDITIKSQKTKYDKYNRYLADIYKNYEMVNSTLVKEGLAKIYNGGKKEKWTDEELNYILKG